MPLGRSSVGIAQSSVAWSQTVIDTKLLIILLQGHLKVNNRFRHLFIANHQ